MNKLPFEEEDRKIIVKKGVETNPAYGFQSDKRPIDQLLQYGIVNLNKSQGPSSHVVADYVKKILCLSKSGNTGTLDPNVSGVLPITLERATRTGQMLLSAGKEYICFMKLHADIPEEKIREALQSFVGSITQMPPVKSAVKRQLRERNIYYLEILEIDGRNVLFKVGCQAGTYIRTICLHPTIDIITNNGFVSAENFFNNPTPIYSFYKGKIIKKHPSAVQRIPSPKKMIKLKTNDGTNIIVTPDHKLLISTYNGYKMIEAWKIRKGDYLVKSLCIPNNEKEHIVADLLDDEYLIAQPEIKEECKKEFVKTYGSIRGMYRNLKFDRKAFLKGSKCAISIKHLKTAKIYNKVKKRLNVFKTQKGNIIKLDSLNRDHYYLMGLIASDGNNTKEKRTRRFTRIKFGNKEKCLIDRFIEIYKNLFPNIHISKKSDKGFFIVDTTNSLFATICASLGILSPQSKSDLLPILNSKKEFIRAFLKGYFDGDGTAHFKKRSIGEGCTSSVYICCCSETNTKRIHQMLLKLGIQSKISLRTTGFRDMYAIHINGIASQKKFINEIGTNHPRKNDYFKRISRLKDKEFYDKRYVGFHYKNYITFYEKKLRVMGGNLSRVLFNKKIPLTRYFYERCAKIVNIPKLDGVVIERVERVESTKGEGFVYDITVPRVHNFLIENGIVSSNCTDFGRKLEIGAHMQQLIRTKAGPFTDKDWVTLQDLQDAYSFWKEDGNEILLRKYVTPFEKAAEHLPKVWVFDSAVHTICSGAEVYVSGISKFNPIQAKERVAIMTLKDELIGFGTAAMETEEIWHLQKGVAVKPDAIFMDRNAYPKQERK